MNKERAYGHLCIFTANVIFGCYIPMSKYILAEYISGEVLTLFRFWGATLLFWLASLMVKNDKMSFRDLMLTLLFAIFGIALNQGIFIYGLTQTSPVDASVIVTITPLMVLVITAIFLHDPITKRKGSGVLLGAAGAIWLVLSTNRITSSTGTMYGDIIILCSGLATAIYYSFSKPLTSRHNPITLMKWMFLFSSILFIPITPAIFEMPDAFKNDIDFRGLVMILYVVVGATFITYLLIAMAIKRMRPTTMAMYNYVQPVVSSFLAILLVQDTFSFQKLCSAFMIFAGVYLVTSSRSATQNVLDKPAQ